MTTFKLELKNYKRPRSSAIKAHLQRWLDDDRTEAVWTKVNKAAGEKLTPGELIQHVIRARAKTAALPAQIAYTALERDFVKKWHAPQIKQALAKGKTLSEIADILEDAAFEMRLIEKVSLLATYPAGVISRKNQDGSQARRAFSLIMSEFFKQRCDKWMDNEVAVLLDVALPRKEATDIQEVRDYRTKRDKDQKTSGGFEPQKLH